MTRHLNKTPSDNNNDNEYSNGPINFKHLLGNQILKKSKVKDKKKKGHNSLHPFFVIEAKIKYL